MGTLHHHPFFIRYQGGAGDHVVQIRAGRTLRSGVGQSFWLRAGRCALAEVPTANRAHSFLVQATTADQQNINAQVAITYHIEDAEAAADPADVPELPADIPATTLNISTFAGLAAPHRDAPISADEAQPSADSAETETADADASDRDEPLLPDSAPANADAAPDMPAELPAATAATAATTTLAASTTQAAPVAESASTAPATPAAAPASPVVAGTSEQDDWPPMSEMLQSFFVFEPTTVAPEPITVMGLDCARPRGLAGLAEAPRQLAEQADVI